MLSKCPHAQGGPLSRAGVDAGVLFCRHPSVAGVQPAAEERAAETEAAASPVAGSDKPRIAARCVHRRGAGARHGARLPRAPPRNPALPPARRPRRDRALAPDGGGRRPMRANCSAPSATSRPRSRWNSTRRPTRKAPREVAITVEPGELTRVDQRADRLQRPDRGATPPPRPSATRSAPTGRCAPGQPFTQQAWDNAKAAALRSLTAKRYPHRQHRARAAPRSTPTAARPSSASTTSPARPTASARWCVRGSQRYDADGARRIARVPTGSDYDQQKLLDAQQRLAEQRLLRLGLPHPRHRRHRSAVRRRSIAQVREAPLQKVVLGVGFTTDSGPRAVGRPHPQPACRCSAGAPCPSSRSTGTRKSLGTEWNAIPDDNGWRWFGSGQLKNEVSGSYKVDSGRLRGGRSQGQRPHRLQLLPAVRLRAEPRLQRAAVGFGAERQLGLDRPLLRQRRPRRRAATALALELGAGYTLTGERLPFTRTYARWLGIVPARHREERRRHAGAQRPHPAARRSRRGGRQGQRADSRPR